ncbi:uncharacterized YkwD family protein [Ureibacillus xyleni]|uniref:Uncharacterized YkwD family protein n=1 Tax=Ureibacillus xyleni TaxID=614648 RepID=A0A285TRX9_9BACL|nr:CAP domain-containing protein [Ureibacillus xyleni]SOC23777.1 uncharacterized YkwD family protein [Ureibacillus xyleni]
MKKWFMTFCALGLLATQVPTADAASNTEEVKNDSIQSYVKVIKLDQQEVYNALSNKEDLKDLSIKLLKSNVNIEKLLASCNIKVNKQQLTKLVEAKKEAKQETSKAVKETPATPAKQTAPTVSKPTTNNNNIPQNTTQQAAKPTTSAPVNTSASEFEKQVVELTNAERAKAGLAPLQMDNAVMASAHAKSVDMAKNNYFSHTSPTYGSPFDQMKAAGISYRSAGENIAQGQQTPEQVVQAWMNSEGHRANILNGNFTHIGVGYVADGNYWTQQFIQK